MLVWRQKLNARLEASKIHSRDDRQKEFTRRAIGLVPSPREECPSREITESERFRYQQVLISVEGKESTCCFKVISPIRRSRAAVLVFRGRVLGCVYGRKDLEGQLFGKEAFRELMEDMASLESVVDTYVLSEQLALAGASLFHGSVFNQPSFYSPKATFDKVYNHLVSTQMPGCIVTRKSPSDQVVGFAYVFGGRLVGVYSYKSGWLDNTYEAATAHLIGNDRLSVSGSKLEASNIEQVHRLTFSLTGIDEPRTPTGTHLIPMDADYRALSSLAKNRLNIS